MPPRVYIEPWAALYGSPVGVLADQQEHDAKLLEPPDDPSRNAIRPRPQREVAAPMAFVDGVRRLDGQLYAQLDGGRVARGVAGTHGHGAVRWAPDEPARVVAAEIRRQIVWGGGVHVDLPPFEVISLDDEDPDALVLELTNRMRLGEAELAERLAADGTMVLVDGPLSYIRSRDLPIAGYVKTHHRQLLSAADQARVALLQGGERTPLFQVRRYFYTCYLRLVDRGQGGPWHGIVRLEVPQSAGIERCSEVVDALAARLPRFASTAHKDARAPVNLVPIGALERALKHRLGHPRLAQQALRRAAAAPPVPTPSLI